MVDANVTSEAIIVVATILALSVVAVVGVLSQAVAAKTQERQRHQRENRRAPPVRPEVLAMLSNVVCLGLVFHAALCAVHLNRFVTPLDPQLSAYREAVGSLIGSPRRSQ